MAPLDIFKKQTFRFILLLGVVFYAPGCATTQRAHAPKEETNLKEICGQNNVLWEWDSVSEVVTLNRGGLKAKAMIGSSTVIVDDEPIVLNSPLKRKKGIVIVPPDFKSKVIDRLQGGDRFDFRRFHRIILDPGHGGKDPGAIGRSGIKEKNITLDIAKRLKRKLEEKGIDVVMTRNDDTFISLDERTQIAARGQGDFFISIHANASRARNVNGAEIFYLRDSARTIKDNDEFEKNCGIYFNQLSLSREPVVERILLDVLSQHKEYESQKLADYLSKNSLETPEAKSRGSKTAGFYVLKNTLMPAVLIEVGFLTNKGEEDLLKTNSYRQKIADNLANGIAGYIE